MAKSIGIDFGTTTSSVAVVDEGEPRVVENSNGARQTPSVVGLTADRELCVGRRAQARGLVYPARTVPNVKRLLGRASDEPVVERYRELHAAEVIGSGDGVRVQLGERSHAPEKLVAAILAELRRAAERHLGEAVESAVFAVPAMFTELQRSAVQEAAEMARLQVRRLINAPTAAGIEQGRGGPEEATQAVVDAGGGGFDVSILGRRKGVFEVEATAGSTELGGWEFDCAVFEWLFEACRDALDERAADDPTTRERLLRAAGNARRELSDVETTWVSIPQVAGRARSGEFPIELARKRFESLVEEEVGQIEATCRRALDEADIAAAEVDELSIVGGLGATPLLRERIEEVFGVRARRRTRAGESVVRGAAFYAGLLEGELEEFVMLEVTPMDLGLRIEEDVFMSVVPRNTAIPTRETRSVTTTRDGQTDVTIEVVQGNSDRASENRLLGMFTLTGIPEAEAGDAEVEVTFEVDSDGMVDISAEEVESGRRQSISVEGHEGVSDETIRASVERFESEVEDEDEDAESEKVLADWLDDLDADSESGDWVRNPSTSVTAVDEEALGDRDDSEADTDVEQDDEKGGEDASAESAPKSWRRRYEEEHADESNEDLSREAKVQSLRESAASRLNRKIENLEPPENQEEAQAYFNRGYRAYKNHGHANAIRYFQQAFEFDEDNALYKAYYAYATFLSNPGQLERSKELLREAVWAQDPQVAPDAHFFLGRVLKVEDHHGQAKRHFREALELDPKLKGAERELRLYEQREGED